MNRAPAPVTSIEEMSLNRLWAAPKLPRLSFNQLAVSGCTVAVPSDQLGRRRAGGQPRHTRRGLSMMVTIRQTPSAGGRFPVARRPRVLGGSLLAERYHERAVGIVVGARPLLNHGLREAEGLRTDRPALRVARQHDRLAAREPDLDGPGLDISGRLDTQANGVRRLADGGRERGGRGGRAAVVWGGAGIAGAPPRRRQETDQQERAGHARYAAGGGERDEGFRRRAACAGTRTDPLAKGHAAASWARDYLAGTPCAVPGRARESRTRAYQGTAHALHPPSRGRQRPPVRVVGQFDAGS